MEPFWVSGHAVAHPGVGTVGGEGNCGWVERDGAVGYSTVKAVES